MNSQEIKALTGRYIMNTYGRFPVAVDHGRGARLYSPEGREYIDFTSDSKPLKTDSRITIAATGIATAATLNPEIRFTTDRDCGEKR